MYGGIREMGLCQHYGYIFGHAYHKGSIVDWGLWCPYFRKLPDIGVGFRLEVSDCNFCKLNIISIVVGRVWYGVLEFSLRGLFADV